MEKTQISRCAPVRLLNKVIVSVRQYGIPYTLKRILWTLRNRLGYYRAPRKTGLYSRDELRRQREDVFPAEISFSIIVPLYNTPKKFLRKMIRSVREQTYSNWELCLADGSDADHSAVESICRRFAEKDKRIRYRKLDANFGISGNTNAALEMARGDYIALLDHDDVLHPAALYAVTREILRKNADFLYTDEGIFRRSPNVVFFPHFKPDYAPDTLRGNNYICHFTVFQRVLLEKTGVFRPECDGSQDFDMVLRLTEHAKRIVHIPELLYYWRACPGSTADSPDAKPYATQAGIRALRDHLARIGAEGEVCQAEDATVYRIRYRLKEQPLVSVIIANKDHKAYLEGCINSIREKTSYPNWEIIVVENGSTETETWAYYEELKKDSRIRVVTWEGKFNYSAVNNFGAGFANGKYFLLLNNDTRVISPEWIEEMLMFAQREEVGGVGAKLYYQNDTVQHAGVRIGFPGPVHYHDRQPRKFPGYACKLLYAQNVSAVTGACMMIPRKVWEQVGGLEEDFAVAYNDVDLCMRIRKAGYLIVWTPFAELYHYESISRGYEDTPEKLARFNKELALLASRWERELQDGDPYYNPNFVPERADFSFDQPIDARKRIRAKEDC